MQEKSKIKKEKWGKPKLTILIRGKPEERVTQVCKIGRDFIVDGSGPNYNDEGCGVRPPWEGCGWCAAQANS